MNWQIAPEFRGTFIRRIAAAAAFSLFAFFAVPSSGYAGSTDLELRPWRGNDRPTFVLPTSAGPAVALKAERGHVVIVHFFATWCEPCREELPALNRLATRTDGTVKVLAIAVAEVDVRVRRFLETTSVSFPVLLDRGRTVARQWDVSTLPTTFILDAELRPRLVVETDFAWDRLDSSKLNTLLAEDAAEIRPIKNVQKPTMEERR